MEAVKLPNVAKVLVLKFFKNIQSDNDKEKIQLGFIQFLKENKFNTVADAVTFIENEIKKDTDYINKLKTKFLSQSGTTNVQTSTSVQTTTPVQAQPLYQNETYRRQGVTQEQLNELKTKVPNNEKTRKNILNFRVQKVKNSNLKQLIDFGISEDIARIGLKQGIPLDKIAYNTFMGSPPTLPFNQKTYNAVFKKVLLPYPYVGMKNCGTNACFLNSTIQMLYHIPEFKTFIQNSGESKEPIKTLKEIFAVLDDRVTHEDRWFPGAKNNYVNVLDLYNFDFECMADRERNFREQEDVMIFLRSCILDTIRDQEYAKITENKPPVNLFIPNVLSFLYHNTETNIVGFYDKQVVIHNGILNLGKTTDNTLWKIELSKLKEVVNSLPLSIKNQDATKIYQLQNIIHHNKNDYLPMYRTAESNITGSQIQPKCIKKESKLNPYPNYLIINIQKGRNNPITGQYEKLQLNVLVNRVIDLDGTYYSCEGAVGHSGYAGGGHYIYYWFDATNGRWLLFNDEVVTELQDDTTKAHVTLSGGGYNFNVVSYILLFKKLPGKPANFDALSKQAQNELQALGNYQELSVYNMDNCNIAEYEGIVTAQQAEEEATKKRVAAEKEAARIAAEKEAARIAAEKAGQTTTETDEDKQFIEDMAYDTITGILKKETPIKIFTDMMEKLNINLQLKIYYRIAQLLGPSTFSSEEEFKIPHGEKELEEIDKLRKLALKNLFAHNDKTKKVDKEKGTNTRTTYIYDLSQLGIGYGADEYLFKDPWYQQPISGYTRRQYESNKSYANTKKEAKKGGRRKGRKTRRNRKH